MSKKEYKNQQEKLEKANKFIEELNERGLIKNFTWKETLISLLASGKRVYMGIDPTADFLHLGHYLGLSILKRFIDKGYPVVILIGSLTARIGDPSFRSKERKLNLDIERNAQVITEQIKRFFKNHLKEKDEHGTFLCEIVDNYELHNNNLLGDILIQKQPLNVLLQFISDVCSCLNISELTKRDFLIARLNNGLTLAELLYTCLQGWDFLTLYQQKNVAIQIGGSDQWGNMLSGLEMIFKHTLKESLLDEDTASNKYRHAGVITFPLLTDDLGNKFGKSEDNAISINDGEIENKNSYEVMQYLLNVPDSVVHDYLLKLTNFSIADIKAEVSKDIRSAKQKLAYAVCEDIFGGKKTLVSSIASQDMFSGLIEIKKYKDLIHFSKFIPHNDCIWNENLKLSSIFQALGLVKSKSEFNRLVSSNGIFVHGVSYTELEKNGYLLKHSYVVWDEDNTNRGVVLVRRGKKHFGLMHVSKIESPFSQN